MNLNKQLSQKISPSGAWPGPMPVGNSVLFPIPPRNRHNWCSRGLNKEKGRRKFGGPVREVFIRWEGNQALALNLPNARAAQRAFQSSRRDPRAQGILWSVFCASFRTEISQRRLVFILSLLRLGGLCRLIKLMSDDINDGALGRRLGDCAGISAQAGRWVPMPGAQEIRRDFRGLFG